MGCPAQALVAPPLVAELLAVVSLLAVEEPLVDEGTPPAEVAVELL